MKPRTERQPSHYERAATRRKAARTSTLVPASQALAEMGLPYTTLRHLAFQGEFPVVKVGRAWYFRRLESRSLYQPATPTTRLRESSRMSHRPLRVHLPPALDSDEPLDDNEMALIRALVRIIVKEIREEAIDAALEEPRSGRTVTDAAEQSEV